LALGLAVASVLPVSVTTFDRAQAATAEDLNKDADQALKTLYRTNPVAEQISKSARAILVFPKIIKAGLVFGGSYGEGVLKQGPKIVNYYNSVSG
jgi:lipid-binding SYLF domain-containing protein